jgi:hypothetical protein
VAGCEAGFSAIEENPEQSFAVYGVVDAAADTQFIRVESLTDSVAQGAPPDLDATVTLENVDTGAIDTLVDRYERPASGTARVHNFWTTMPIEPETTYRLTVQSTEDPGKTATATATVPPAFPDPEPQGPVIVPCPSPDLLVEVPGVERLAEVKIGFLVEDLAPAPRFFGHLPDTSRTSSGYVLRIDYDDDLRQIGPPTIDGLPECATPSRAELKVAAAGPNWPRFPEGQGLQASLGRGTSNVEGGTGLFGGVIRKTVEIRVQRGD